MTPFIGVRISWLMVERNSDFAFDAISASSRAQDQLHRGAMHLGLGLADGEDEPHAGHEEGPGGQGDCGLADMPDGGREEHEHPDRGPEGRQHEPSPPDHDQLRGVVALVAGQRSSPRRLHPGRQGQHQQGDGPDHGVGDVAQLAVGLQEVEHVADGIHRHGHGGDGEEATVVPGEDGERADRQGEQQNVTDRVGQTRGGREIATPRGAQDGVEEEGRRERGHGQSDDQPVQRRGHQRPVVAAPDEHHEAQVAEREEGHVEPIGDRRRRHRRAPERFDGDRDVTEGPRQTGHPEHQGDDRDGRLGRPPAPVEVPEQAEGAHRPARTGRHPTRPPG